MSDWLAGVVAWWGRPGVLIAARLAVEDDRQLPSPAARCHRDQAGTAIGHGDMDLRLRLAARIPLVAESLRVTKAGRAQMLAELALTGLTDVIAALAKRYVLEPTDLTWQETPEPEGTNDSRIGAYQMVVRGINARDEGGGLPTG